MEKINKIYEKQGFFDLYNGSVFFTISLLIAFFLMISYYLVKTQIIPIRNNWNKERCNPSVIPFAGMINAPPNTSVYDYTYENFNYCINNIIKDVTSDATKPISAILHLFKKFLSGIKDAINDIRKVIDKVRTGVEDVSRNIMERTLNILIPFQVLMIAVKDIMGKAQALKVAGMYAAMGVYFTLMSSLGNIYNFIITLLVAMSAELVELWLDPFTWGEAAMYTAVYAMISIPTGLVGAAINMIMELSGDSHCFSKNTLIRDSKNILHSIESIPLGTELYRGGKVTAKLRLDASREKMYKLGNVCVSGSHTVLHDKKWIKVCNHPNAILVKNFYDNEIYCLNTTSKKIYIDEYIFQDWDEIDNERLNHLGCSFPCEIYEKYEGGFHPDTILDNSWFSNKIKIQDIKIGDTLSNGEIVTGIVEILNDKILYEYDNNIIGSDTLENIQSLGNKSVAKSEKYTQKLFHILTNTGYFHINNQKVSHYNKNIDFFL